MKKPAQFNRQKAPMSKAPSSKMPSAMPPRAAPAMPSARVPAIAANPPAMGAPYKKGRR